MTQIAVDQLVLGEELVRRAARGDEIAFARLISEHNAHMARVAFVICGDREATLDAVQTAWATAWRKLSSVRDGNQIRSWLVAIAANEARQHVRRRRRATVVDISEAMSTASHVDPDFAPIVDLERALGDLNADDRRLIALRYVAELDSTEIAVLLGLSASGVRSRLARLLERLRIVLEPGGGTAE